MTLPALLACAIWAYLLLGHGRFWQAGPVLAPVLPASVPPVAVVVPARDEAAVIGAAIGSLLGQDYPGELRIVLVDDGSSDGTAEVALAAAARTGDPSRLVVVEGRALPSGWSGKLWAIEQGLGTLDPAAWAYVLLTDADIVHEPAHLATLVAHAQTHDLDLVSEMVRLRCVSWPERALIPAFVFFFQLLYPFAWVNDPQARTAAAAGGTLLVRARALARIGGMAAVREALIDDVALAKTVKAGGRIWLGHSRLARSVRPYPGLRDIWQMVSRTAYVQLRFRPSLLALTAAGMVLVWIVPPLALLAGHGLARLLGGIAWIAASASYLPTLRRFDRSPLWAPSLPAVAAFYLAATFGSAARHHAGRGVVWKARSYGGAGP